MNKKQENVERVGTDLAQADEIEVEAVPVALFQGYDNVFGDGRSTAVEGKTVTTGAISEVRCSVCESVEDLAQSLEVDQSLSVGFGPLGGGDEKMKFLTSLKMTTHSIAVTVFARHVIGTQTVTDVHLKKDAQDLMMEKGLNDFTMSYGDSYLSEITEGGEYFAVYTFYSQTKEEQTDLSGSLQAHGVINSATVEGSLQSKMSDFLKEHKTRYSFPWKTT
jgi:hypothetical protein